MSYHFHIVDFGEASDIKIDNDDGCSIWKGKCIISCKKNVLFSGFLAGTVIGTMVVRNISLFHISLSKQEGKGAWLVVDMHEFMGHARPCR